MLNRPNRSGLRYLDVCAGISAPTVAWAPLGWTCAAYSEIEPFPRAVLAHHYPDTPLHVAALIERLEWLTKHGGYGGIGAIAEAADHLTRLEADNAAKGAALEPFANIARQARKSATDDRWLETVLFYAGDDNDPTKWSLTGKAFDAARIALQSRG